MSKLRTKIEGILADKIRYDKIKDIGIATGNVKIYETDDQFINLKR